MYATTVKHKFCAGETIYFHCDFGVAKGRVERVEVSQIDASLGPVYVRYLVSFKKPGAWISSYDTIAEEKTFISPEAAFKVL